MTLPVFVVPSDALGAETITLDGDEGRHAAAVRRIRVGERIMLTDGSGHGAECDVVSVAKASLQCEVRVRREEPPAVPRLTVVQAIPKGDHADRAVDLLAEVGVDVIVPWAASRNVVQWRGERAAKGVARWGAVAVAAAKQARRLRFPEVRGVATTDDVAALLRGADLGLVLHESAGQSLAALLDLDRGPAVAGDAMPPAAGTSLPGASMQGELQGEVVIVVGPEGGITDDELAEFRVSDGEVTHLGPTVLRTSSAGVVAAALVLSRTPRWH